MDFNQLLSKMQEIDTTPAAIDTVTDECGMDMPPMPSPAMKQDAPPPSMSVNVNAQGMDNIEDMLSLIAKLGGAGKADMPSMAPMPPIMPLDKMIPPPGPIDGKPGLGDIPDMDADNDDKVGGEKDTMDLPKDHDDDHVIIKTLDKDGDMDHDMDDHDKEKDDEKDDDDKTLDLLKAAAGTVNSVGSSAPGPGTSGAGTYSPSPSSTASSGGGGSVGMAGSVKDAYDNEPDESNKDADYMNNKLAGGMNRPKDTHPKVSDGDNPMKKVKEGDELRAQIHAELAAKLEQFMGAK
jgi:hypothetical protein